MEMEQMTTCLLAEMKAEIRTNQAKADVNLKDGQIRCPSRKDDGQD
jgi:hypothetical protein